MTNVLCDDTGLTREPYVYHEYDDGGSVWHETGRAARWEIEDNNSLSLTLFYGSDPWITTACLTPKTEEDALAIVKAWCENNILP